MNGKQYQFQTEDEIFTHDFLEYLGLLATASKYVERDRTWESNEKICKKIQVAVHGNNDAQCIMALSKTSFKSVKNNVKVQNAMDQMFDVLEKTIDYEDEMK